MLVVRGPERVPDAAPDRVVNPGERRLSCGLQVCIHHVLHQIHGRGPKERENTSLHRTNWQDQEGVVFGDERVEQIHERCQALGNGEHGEMPVHFEKSL